MPPKTLAEVLEEAKRLPAEDQRRLIEELTQPAAPPKEDAKGENGKVRTLYDALEARGLIGFMTDGPPDLSTNPKYMEGFGRDAG
jgi:hypothetical protein